MRTRRACFAGLLFAAGMSRAEDLDGAIAAAAHRHGLDEQLVRAVATVESGLNPRAVSPKGAVGIMQLMPSTATRFGVTDPLDAASSLEGGCAYLRFLLDRFGTVELALAGYNAGERAVDEHGGIPPYEETVGYVAKVLGLLGGGSPRLAGFVSESAIVTFDDESALASGIVVSQ